MPWPSACMWTLPGFRAWSSVRHASRNARRSPAGSIEATLGRALELEDMSGNPIGDVDVRNALQAFPSWHRVYLEHHEATRLVLDEVDPAIGCSDRARRGDRKLGELPRARCRLANAAERNVGDPARAVPHHRGKCLVSDHEHPVIAPVALAADVALKVEDAPERIARSLRQGRVAAEPLEAAALGTEQRFGDDIAGLRPLPR